MGITNSAMLVELNISVWTASKLDKTETSKVTTSNSAVKGAAQVRKNLMAGTSYRKDIADYASSCRLWHNSITLPWADKGARLIPTSLFLEYKTEANTRKAKFDKMVTDFINVYPSLVQTAQNYLVGLFDPNDYPDAEVVRSKFGYKQVFSPVPESSDFRLQVAEEDLVELREQYDESYKSRLADAMKDPWNRLHTTLTAMSVKLHDEDGADVAKRYHDTLVTNAQGLCSVLTHLNITGDPELEKARKQLEITMLDADIEVIKESPEVRKSMKVKVDDILKQFEW